MDVLHHDLQLPAVIPWPPGRSPPGSGHLFDPGRVGMDRPEVVRNRHLQGDVLSPAVRRRIASSSSTERPTSPSTGGRAAREENPRICRTRDPPRSAAVRITMRS